MSLALEVAIMIGYPRIYVQNAETIMAFEAEYMTVSLLTASNLNFFIDAPHSSIYDQHALLVVFHTGLEINPVSP